MTEYIEREAAIMTAMDYGGSGSAQDASQDIAAALGCIPAADVVPVVHARWIEDGDNQPISCDKCYCCSNCHGNRRFEWHLKPFCEDCGANMREEQDG